MNGPVLIIEDNPQNRYLATYLLEHNGHEVVAVVDGDSGIECVQKVLPCLILLDIQLPTIDGYAVARALRRIESIARIPIVAFTSYAMPGDREKAIEAGCTGYIEKPIDPDTFIATLESLGLAKRSPRKT